MTTLDYKNAKPGLFSIYKPGQGMYVRWGTVAGLAICILGCAWWVGFSELPGYWQVSNVAVQTGAAVGVAVILGFLAFMLVNSPKFAEFLIMTESEMRKVTWPSRREVIVSTKIVILMTLIMAVILAVVDLGFYALFAALHVLKE